MREGIFNTSQAYKLESPGRIKELRPYELLKNIGGVSEGLTCVDFGSGTGTFALPMADLVGDNGRVYAIDNSSDMMAYIRKKGPPPNLVLIQTDVNESGLDSRIADVCLLAFILHEVKHPDNLVAEASRLLRPEGKVIIVEWKAELDSPGPPRKRRISREQIERLFGQAGLALVSYTDWTKNHYVVVGVNK